MSALQKVTGITAADLGSLLDAGDGAVVTLEARETCLAAHRAVLAARSPVFAAMFAHDTLEASSGVVTIPDVEGTVLRQLVTYLYTLQTPQLPDMACQLLQAADKYGLSDLKAECERQVAAHLSVENAVAAAILAVRHSCDYLKQVAIKFMKTNIVDILGTQGWADAMHSQSKELIEVSRLVSAPLVQTRMEPLQQATATDLGGLLVAGDGAVVTLEAGETCLAAHRAVLAARTPVFAAMFAHDTLEASSGVVTIPDVEGAVLRQLVSYLYTLQTPQLPDMAAQLLVAANKYGLSDLKVECEQQVLAQLTVETAAAAAVLAVRHSCDSLKQAAVKLMKTNLVDILDTQGWADVMRSQAEDLIEVSRLISAPPAETRGLSSEEQGKRLSQAANAGAVEELESLLAAGADVGARDGGRPIGLHRAAREGHVEAARRLLAAGAAVEARNSMQSTALHCAAEKGHTAVAQLLLDSGAYHSARNKFGYTPLHYAAEHGHREVASALLKAGAHRGARNDSGKTPLDVARRKNHQQLVDLLMTTS